MSNKWFPLPKIEPIWSSYRTWTNALVNKLDLSKLNDLNAIDFLQSESTKLIVNEYATDIVEFVASDLLANSFKGRKSKELAAKWKTKGDDFRIQGKWIDGVKCYSSAIIMAPHPLDDPEDTTISLSYGFRSECLYNMGEYEGCIRDVDNAVKFDHPTTSTDFIHHLIRQAECYKLTGRDSEAKDALSAAKTFIADKDVANKIHYFITNLDELWTNETECDDANDVNLYELGSIPLVDKVVDKCDVFVDEQGCKYITAKECLRLDETILTEEPFSYLLSYDLSNSRCHHCCKELNYDLYPCRYCHLVRFCSNHCQEKGWNEYHSHECELYSLLMNMGVGHLAARTLFKVGIELASELSKDFISEGRVNDKLLAENSHAKEYVEVLKLPYKSDWFTKEDSVRDSLAAIYTGLLLKQTEKLRHEHFDIICHILVIHIRQILSNNDFTPRGRALGVWNQPVLFIPEHLADPFQPVTLGLFAKKVPFIRKEYKFNATTYFTDTGIHVKVTKLIPKGGDVIINKEFGSNLFKCENNPEYRILELHQNGTDCLKCKDGIMKFSIQNNELSACLSCGRHDPNRLDFWPVVAKSAFKSVNKAYKGYMQQDYKLATEHIDEATKVLSTFLTIDSCLVSALRDISIDLLVKQGNYKEAFVTANFAFAMKFDVFAQNTLPLIYQRFVSYLIEAKLIGSEYDTFVGIKITKHALKVINRLSERNSAAKKSKMWLKLGQELGIIIDKLKILNRNPNLRKQCTLKEEALIAWKPYIEIYKEMKMKIDSAKSLSKSDMTLLLKSL